MIVQVVVVSAWLEWLYNHSKKQLESTAPETKYLGSFVDLPIFKIVDPK